MRKKIMVMVMMLSLLLTGSTALAAPQDSNAMAAVALYIDTSGSYVPGMDLLNKALNEVVRFKVNALMLGSEVQSGNEVLRDLSRCGVNSAQEATPTALNAYGNARHVNYILLLAVRPLDVAVDVKTYSTVSGSYVLDETITKPESSEGLSTLDTLSGMISDKVGHVLESLRASAAAWTSEA